MKMKNFFSKLKLTGKGFAAAVCVCLLAVGGAGIYSYTKVADRLNEQLISQNKNTSSDKAADKSSDDAQVNAEQTSVAKPEETTAAAEEAKDADVTVTEAAEKTENADAQTMVRPLNGEILNEFSDGELVKSATLNVWKTHDGVDIAGNLNEKVKSMTSGTVTKVYEDQMLGACVIIDHGSGLEGYYCNLSKDIPVVEGQTVSAGTIIGTVGDTAEGEIKEASHLHFGLKKNGEWIDPIELISGEGS